MSTLKKVVLALAWVTSCTAFFAVGYLVRGDPKSPESEKPNSDVEPSGEKISPLIEVTLADGSPANLNRLAREFAQNNFAFDEEYGSVTFNVKGKLERVPTKGEYEDTLPQGRSKSRVLELENSLDVQEQLVEDFFGRMAVTSVRASVEDLDSAELAKMHVGQELSLTCNDIAFAGEVAVQATFRDCKMR